MKTAKCVELIFPNFMCTSDLFDREEAERRAQAAKEKLPGLSGDELTMVIERMGQLVLGVKTLFDSKCAPKKDTVLAYDVPGMCSFFSLLVFPFTSIVFVLIIFSLNP